ncbi:hypothetical protein SNEBB_008730 [Seison nebaliae]|nr:hypothetical protein SNEBB_008730 [Seison nebaliae]
MKLMKMTESSTSTFKTNFEKTRQIWKGILTKQYDWKDKDDFLDSVYWGRQLMALITGIIWGFLPLVGYIGILLFIAVNIVTITIYTKFFQRVNDEDYGGMLEIFKEGMGACIAIFMLSWISSFTYHNEIVM